jgi:hypothetical protein
MDKNKLVILGPALAMLSMASPAHAQLSQIFGSDPNLLRCESVNNREVTCAVPSGKVAEFVEQNSQAACIRGQTYAVYGDRITVTRGCRATFRLSDTPMLTGTALTAALRAELATDLARRLRDDYHLSSTPSVSLQSDHVDPLSSSQVRYEGTARADRNGSFWKAFEFTSTYDARDQDFSSLTYKEVAYDSDRNDDDTSTATDMDEDVEEALARALAAEVRRQKGGGDVQVVINRRFRSDRERGDLDYQGKFGYSWNDGSWVTRRYEATFNPSGMRVREVHIYRVSQ